MSRKNRAPNLCDFVERETPFITLTIISRWSPCSKVLPKRLRRLNFPLCSCIMLIYHNVMFVAWRAATVSCMNRTNLSIFKVVFIFYNRGFILGYLRDFKGYISIVYPSVYLSFKYKELWLKRVDLITNISISVHN